MRKLVQAHRNKSIIIFHHITLIYGLSLYNFEWPYVLISIASAYICFAIFGHPAHHLISHRTFKPAWWKYVYLHLPQQAVLLILRYYIDIITNIMIQIKIHIPQHKQAGGKFIFYYGKIQSPILLLVEIFIINQYYFYINIKLNCTFYLSLFLIAAAIKSLNSG